MAASPQISKTFLRRKEGSLFSSKMMLVSYLALGNQMSVFVLPFRFTDNRVFLQKIPSQRSNPLAAVAELPNHKQLVFQVWQKLPCEAHKRMRKYKKERKLMSDLSDDDAPEYIAFPYSLISKQEY